MISSYRSKANSFTNQHHVNTIKRTIITISKKYFNTFHISRLKFGKCSKRKISPKSNIIETQEKSIKQL